VGAKLSFPDGRVQHEGITVGVGGVAVNTNSRGYFSIGNLVRNCWALTAACLMVRPEVFWEVGGFEERLRVAFNDVDLTMRIHQLGYDLIYQPNANLLHQESALRGSLHPMEDENFFRERWGEPLRQDDPYYNPRLSRHAQYYFHDEVKQVWLPRGHPLA
ncbi:MAG: glycosyltransferase family 2 protein, partial [Actinomycetota bacterium]|nr:glycosyltransferase family 2 protein [Actinomycetota bacterium]